MAKHYSDLLPYLSFLNRVVVIYESILFVVTEFIANEDTIQILRKLFLQQVTCPGLIRNFCARILY